MSGMDRDWGAKAGGGGVASDIQQKVDRRERLRQLALQTVDLMKDPYFMKNHLGSYECKLCLTLHNNEGNYLAHTQGKRHQQNLARRAAKEARDNPVLPQANRGSIKPRKTVKIGRPGTQRPTATAAPTAVPCCLTATARLSHAAHARPAVVRPPPPPCWTHYAALAQATASRSNSTQRPRSARSSSRSTTPR